MPWISANLSAAIGPIAEQAQAAIAQVQTGLALIGGQISAIDDKLAASQAAVNTVKDKMSALESSGFYMINLAPEYGAWDDRMEYANNAPPHEPHFYCVGTASIIISPNMAAATDAYATMKQLMMAPVDDVGTLIPSAGGDFIPSEIPIEFAMPPFPTPAEDWADQFATDTWSSAVLGDVFGGKREGLGSKLKKDVAVSLADFSMNENLRKVSVGLNSNMALVANLLDKADATGAYNITLDAGRGSFVSRLRAEAGSPPSDPFMFSSGFACVAIAPTYAEAAAKYAQLLKVVL